jgi:hypothetical protein
MSGSGRVPERDKLSTSRLRRWAPSRLGCSVPDMCALVLCMTGRARQACASPSDARPGEAPPPLSRAVPRDDPQNEHRPSWGEGGNRGGSLRQRWFRAMGI